MYERFTVRARQVMELSRLEAVRCRHSYIGTEHLLLGLVREGTGVATHVLQSHAVNFEVVRAEIESIVQPGTERVSLRHLQQTPRAKKAIEFSIEEAHDLHHGCVGTEHLLLGLLREPEGLAAQVLTRLGLTADGVRKQIVELHERGDVVPEAALRMHSSAPPPVKPGAWKKFGDWFRDAFAGN
jgi:ATP-dependent Clp protease ATP-binding subunit ClpC